MDDVTEGFMRATTRLQDAGDRFERAVSDTIALQGKHDQVLKRLLDLIRKREKTWDATARASLQSLGGKYAIQHRALEQQLEELTKARLRFERRQLDFEDLTRAHGEVLRDRNRASWRQQKREAALARTLETLIYDLWGRNMPELGPSRFDPPRTSHSYIAMRAPRFLDLLVDIDTLLAADDAYASAEGRYRPVSFLEVGCGQGRIMLLAERSGLVLFDRVEGFDFNPDLVERGREDLGHGDAIFVADAMEFDYGGHDIIYSFRPFADLEMQDELEARMARQMRAGAYLVAPFAHDLDRYPELTRMGDETEIWRKTG